jgi:hypothetical protein
MALEIPRPIDPSLHPLVTGNYRIATPAIEASMNSSCAARY